MSLFLERTNCPVCDYSHSEILIEKNIRDPDLIQFIKLEPTYRDAFYQDFDSGLLNDQLFKVAKCRKCGFVFQRCVLNEKGMEKLYNEWIDHTENVKLYNQKNRIVEDQKYAERIRFVKQHFRDQTLNILDWGAGLGHFCLVANRIGKNNVYAYDYSNTKNKHLSDEGVYVKSEHELVKNYFHFINIDQVLEHVCDPYGLIEKCLAYLRNDGMIFISSPNCSSIEKKLNKNQMDSQTFIQLSPHQHINAFTNKSLKAIAKRAGLTPVFEPFSQLSASYFNKNTDNYLKNLMKPFYRQWMSTTLFFKREIK